MTKYRNVMFSEGMAGVCAIIRTDAPRRALLEWCANYAREQEDGENTWFDSLSEQYHVEILYDSAVDHATKAIGIPYNEIYDLCDTQKNGK